MFEELPNRTNFAYNAILRGLVDTSRFLSALEFFKSMVHPDNFTYPLVFKACSALNALEEGRRVQEIVKSNEINLGWKPNVYVHCSIIDMFSKCGRLDEARKVFDEMPVRDLACWSAIIAGAVHNLDWFEALRLFNRMRLEGTKPDSVIIAVILPACGGLENKQIGTALHSCAVKNSFHTDLYVSNALTDMYCKCGDTSGAHMLFSSMVDKDTVSWNILIAGYSQNCQYQESIELFRKMKHSGFKPNAIVVASVFSGLGKLKLLKHGKEMHGYVLKYELEMESDAVLRCAMIDMYMNCGSPREAETIFKLATTSDDCVTKVNCTTLEGKIELSSLISKRGTAPDQREWLQLKTTNLERSGWASGIDHLDIMMWNSMIAGYFANGDTNLALEIFRSIWRSNLKPNSVTLLSIIPMCTRVGNLRHGKEVHGYAVRTQIGAMVSVLNSLIDMYSKCGSLDLGMRLFALMGEKNVVTYNSVISSLAIHGLGESAFLLLKQMEETGTKPNKVTFTGLLSGCRHAGLVDKGLSLFQSMRHRYNVVPSPEHYSCVVDLLGRAGQIDKALDFVKHMSMNSDVNVLGSLLGACRVHNEVEVAHVLWKNIVGSEELSGSGLHMLLHNVYAASEQRNEALTVRRMMKEKGLEKVAGCSWIQVGESFHSFHAGGGSHPQLNSIYKTLDCLVWEMKRKGY